MAAKIEPKPLDRPLWEVAREILADFRAQGKPIPRPAYPYIEAMMYLEGLDSVYYEDTADMLVMYLLSNLNNWRGSTARRIKQELRAALAHHTTR